MQSHVIESAMKIHEIVNEAGVVKIPENLTPAAFDRLIAEGELMLARDQVKAARDALVATLPFATEEQAAAVIAAARHETEPPVDHKVNEDFRLTPEQVERVAEAKRLREADCIAAKDVVLMDLINDADQKMVSRRVRLSIKGVATTTLKFRKGGQAALPLADVLKALRERRDAK